MGSSTPRPTIDYRNRPAEALNAADRDALIAAALEIANHGLSPEQAGAKATVGAVSGSKRVSLAKLGLSAQDIANGALEQ